MITTLPIARHCLPWALSALVCSISIPLGWAQVGDPNGASKTKKEEQAPRSRPYQVYDSMQVRAIGEQAQEHLDAGRDAEALELLQTLITTHRGEVLPPAKPTPGGRILGTVHVGAPAWARSKLFAMADAQREVYGRMYENTAQAAMQRALELGKQGAWLEVARRWPISQAAHRSRWALGDLAMEEGRTLEGLHAWARALACELDRPEEAPQNKSQWQALMSELEVRVAENRLRTGQAERLGGIRYRARMALDLDLGQKQVGEPSANGLRPGHFSARALDQHESGWPEPVLLPDHPMQREFGYQLQGAVDEENLFLSTSRQVLSLSRWSGEQRWLSPLELPGWSENQNKDSRFNEAIDYRGALYAPAVSEGIVVASLQVPFVLIPPEHFRQIQIIKIMPERRLFAFDAASGTPLWNTAPPRDWDGESGPTSERVSIAGPPTIAGSRVVVPTVHMRGRIEFHVDCFDLHTGEHLWHTPLVTGQRELNMFSREIGEFTAPPVRIEGDRVMVATSIGSVACLDLIRGDTLWQSLYPQIEISTATYYSPGQMRTYWIHSPPVVTERCVLVAPYDSDSLLCFDRQTGDFLWKAGHREFSAGSIRGRSSAEFYYMIDADENRVILGGRRVAAFQPVSGSLYDSRPTQLQWVYPSGDEITNPGLRAVATGNSVLIPSDGELVRVERKSGRPTSSLEWAGRRGSPLITPAGLFTVGRNEVRAYFDWKENLSKARQAFDANPADGNSIHRLALLLQKKGVSERMGMPTPDYQASQNSLRESRDLLRGALSQDGPPPHPELRGLLFSTLVEMGRTQRLAASPDRARASFESALDLAREESETSGALLLLASMDRGRDEVLRRQRLARLADEFGDLEIQCALLDGAQGPAGQDNRRFEPLLTLAQDGQTQASQEIRTLPLGLWARMESTNSLLSSNQRSQVSDPYPDLYEIIRLYGKEKWLDQSAGWVAAETIRTFLDRKHTEGFEAIQERAQEALRLAMERATDAELSAVQRRFPLTRAAERAGEERVRQAAAQGQVGLLAEVVLGSTPLEFSLERTSPKNREQLALLAVTVGDAGGLTFRAELGKRLAESAPRQSVDLGRGLARTLEQWSLEWSAQVPVPPAPPSFTFVADISVQDGASKIVPGQSLWVPPQLSADGTPVSNEPVTLMRWQGDNRRTLTVAAFRRSTEPVWTLNRFVDDNLSHWAVSPGRVHAPTSRGLITVDRDNGETLWRWNAGRGLNMQHVVHAQGVVVATLQERSDRDDLVGDWLQVGLEASSGTELWRRRVSARLFDARALVGSGVMVLFSTGNHASQIFDLFSGAPGPPLRVERLRPDTIQAAWIDRGKLMLPIFMGMTKPSRNHLLAHDLRSGEQAWRLPFGESRDLVSVMQYRGKAYLEVSDHPPGQLEFKSVYELDANRGKLANRPSFKLTGGSRLIGLRKRTLNRIDNPLIFARTSRPDGNFGVRALHLKKGSQWEISVPSGTYLLRPETLPRPMVSEEACILAFPRQVNVNQADLSTYFILGYVKETGRPISDLMLRIPGQHVDGSNWSALGDRLIFGNIIEAQVLGGDSK